MLILSYLMRLTAYECGFEAFGEARSTSDQSFSLVALLFLLFFSGC